MSSGPFSLGVNKEVVTNNYFASASLNVGDMKCPPVQSFACMCACVRVYTATRKLSNGQLDEGVPQVSCPYLNINTLLSVSILLANLLETQNFLP
jgi:hypothetical protein